MLKLMRKALRHLSSCPLQGHMDTLIYLFLFSTEPNITELNFSSYKVLAVYSHFITGLPNVELFISEAEKIYHSV